WVDYAGPGEAPRNRPHADAPDKLADSDSSGPIEEAGADVDDRPQGATPAGTTLPKKPATDITSGATRTTSAAPPAVPTP
ncbi:MAG TPA: hypothetical protein VNG33_11545, partial [Polyangiaceae bacterium]|nr:hypothetical protein [Polyangiaceae bacterium]